MGLRSLQRDRGRPYKCDSPDVVKSAITRTHNLDMTPDLDI